MTTISVSRALRWAALGAAASLGLAVAQDSNYIDLSVGTAQQNGDRANFQKLMQQNKNGFGGIEDFRFSTNVDKNTVFIAKGSIMGGNADVNVDLRLEREDVGHFAMGYNSFRTWYDGSGGYFSPNNLYIGGIFDPILHLDRTDLWFEAKLALPDRPLVLVRYDHMTREGSKDSTSWGESNFPPTALGGRYIAPSLWKIDEKRDIITATVSHDTGNTSWQVGGRVEKTEQDNRRYVRRRAYESVGDRSITHREGGESDMHNVYGSVNHKFTETLSLGAGVSRTKFDTTLDGSRIVSSGFDAAFDPNFSRRQQRDEGFFEVLGETEMKQTIATLNVVYRPNADWTIVPAIRAEKIEWTNVSEFLETNVENFGTTAAPNLVFTGEWLEGLSQKEWKTFGQSIEARYTGMKDWVMIFRGENSNADGYLEEERIAAHGMALPSVLQLSRATPTLIDRETDTKRDVQKISATANWYPRADLNLGFQYYFKARMNDYDSIRDSQNTAADRYPAYITDQDFETNDVNVRVSWRAMPGLRFVTRYDYQETKVKTQDIGLPMGESANMKTNILSESVSYQPLNRWYIQANLNWVKDTLDTPAQQATGAAADIVLQTKSNYVNLGLNSGYALDDKTDLYGDFSLYSGKNFVDNALRTVAYGNSSMETQTGLTLVHRANSNTTYTFRYAYVDNDDTANRFNSFNAHMVYAKVQYRF